MIGKEEVLEMICSNIIVLRRQKKTLSVFPTFIDNSADYNILLALPKEYQIPPNIKYIKLEEIEDDWEEVMSCKSVVDMKLSTDYNFFRLLGAFLLFYDKETEDSKRLNSYIEQIKNYNNHDNT